VGVLHSPKIAMKPFPRAVRREDKSPFFITLMIKQGGAVSNLMALFGVGNQLALVS